MADVIKLLPDSVANQIAAGEVIQRPSSVLKELVENSVDAGATEIQILIRDAGRTLLQVSDNGKGMSPTDTRLAFERHATSKIREASDLFTLHTMGFRGEALPSICAISQVEVLSAQDADEMGTRLIINGSQVELQEPCYCKRGTTISVKNLFFNVPARRRFLKSDTIELSNIIREFERLALVNNHIRFSLDTGTKQRDLRPGTFKQRIAELWKGSLNMELLPVEIDTEIVKIKGFVSRPEHARRRNALQYLIANGRNMRHPYFHRGIMSCFERLIAPDTQPCYFLKFEVDPQTIDVNIHPTKNEIKFENEQQIWTLLTSAIRAALGKFSAVPSIDFDANPLEVEPPRAGEDVYYPSSSFDPNYNPFESTNAGLETPPEFPGLPSFMVESTASNPAPWQVPQQQHSAAPRQANYSTSSSTNVPHDWNKLYDGFMQESAATPPQTPPETSSNLPLNVTQEGVPPLCLQHDHRYIVAPSREGLLIIDQHRAHVKILYEQFMKSATLGQGALQRVMFGEELHLDTTQQAILEIVKDELQLMGITLQPQGDSWVITSLPPTLSGQDGKDAVLHILDALNMESDSYGSETPGADTVRSRVALAMARSGAIRRGQPLSAAEMEKIISDLFKLPDSNTGPDGLPIMCVIDNDKLYKFFN